MNLTILKKINFEKIYFFLFMFLAFGLSLSKALTSIASALILLTWLIEGDFKRKFKEILSSPLLIAIIIFVILAYVSLFWSSDLKFGFKYIAGKYVYLLFIPLIASVYKKEWLNSGINFFLFGMLATELYSLSPFIYEFSIAKEEIFTALKGSSQYFDPIIASIQYSVFLAIASILALNKILSYKFSKITIFWLVFFILSIFSLSISSGRSGQLIFIVLLPLFLIYKFRKNFKIILTFIAILLIGSGIFINNAQKLNLRLIDSFKYEFSELKNFNFATSNGIRVAYYILTWDSVKNNLILGVGAGSHLNEYKKSVSKKELSFLSNLKGFVSYNSAHNSFLMILISFGFFGFFLFLFILFKYFHSCFKIKDSVLKENLIIFMIIFIGGMMTDSNLLANQTRTLFTFFIGLASIFDIKNKN